MTSDEYQLDLSNEELVLYRKEKELRERILNDSYQYKDLAIKEWPVIKINWDIRYSSQKFSLDRDESSEFSKHHPDGFLLGYVNLNEVDKRLGICSFREVEDVWKVGSSEKLSALIVYLSEGREVSPPFLCVYEDSLVIMGGNHRYTIAKCIGVENIPIHFKIQEKFKIDEMLNVKWINHM